MGSYLGRLDGIEKRCDLFDPDQREPTLGRLDGIEKQRDLFDPDQREPTLGRLDGIEKQRDLGRLDGIEKQRDLFDLDRREQIIVCYKQIQEDLARLHEIVKRRDSARQLESEKRRFMFDFDRREETLGRLDGKEKHRAAILNADTTEKKMSVEKQEVFLCNRRSCHGTKLLNSSLRLAHLFVPCAGGTGQPEHQGHSEIYPSSLNVVSNCPSRGEYMQRSLAKCADVCGSYMQDGNCAYHCMRDYSKTKLVEFCAKPKPLFDYCPEYDPVDQTIQKDTATLCNSTFSQNYYNSSDIYFCDPNNCLQLHESSVRSSATTLTTLMSETTEMNGRDSQEWFLPLIIVLAALFAVFIIGYILCVMRGVFSEMRKKRNEKEYV